MKHLKPDEVDYVTRPLTIFEKHLDNLLHGLTESNPAYYQVWGMFLWSRQDEIHPQDLFSDILITDFNGHREACLKALHENDSVNNVLKSLNDNWRFGFRDREVEPETILEAVKRYYD